MHILEELYVGSIRPGERTFKQNSQYGRAIKKLTESEEKLDATLSEEQKSLLDEYRNAQQNLMVITDCETPWLSNRRENHAGCTDRGRGKETVVLTVTEQV